MIIEGVIVVGAGPVGLWAAAELALAGIPTVVLERAQERSPHSKALGLHARTLELLAMRGVQAEFLAEGRAFPYWHFGMLPARIDLHSLDTPFPFMLALPQRRTEELLEQRALELDVSILRGRTVVGLTQDEHAVTLDVLGPDGPVKMAAPFVIGADGSRSVVRDLAGIGFPGTETTAYGFIGEVILDEPPTDSSISRHSAEGALIMVPLGEGRYRLAGVDARRQAPDDELTFAALQETIIRMLGTDLGMRDPSWLTRFPDRTCLAETYRRGRVLLAGDSAHIHWPAGGVGLNVGVQDAMNLGWKLAAARLPACWTPITRNVTQSGETLSSILLHKVH
jgi:2-polyprenyl-6-methoxyphenol hydroxylase-like FAD-dependent oxidoreductase